jgi:hypothetical protein
MARTRTVTAAAVICILGAVCGAHGQDLQVGIIDFYGLNKVSTSQVRSALAFKEGDTISLDGNEPPAFLRASENRVAQLPGVARARTELVCCDHNRAIVYVGVEERGARTMHLRAAPLGTARLPPDIVQSGVELSRALWLAVQRDDAAEDDSLGHALNHDPTTRAIQERFIRFAARDLPVLRRVLRTSSDQNQRALAAEVMGYAPDKQAVVDDLVLGMTDPCDEVRNNAMRALMVFADAAAGAHRPALSIPAQPFIAFLDSPVWSDRNKASGALLALSRNRDPRLLSKLRKEARAPLVEMARWKSEGHALAAFIILGRIAGYTDEEARALWNSGARETVTGAAVSRR